MVLVCYLITILPALIMTVCFLQPFCRLLSSVSVIVSQWPTASSAFPYWTPSLWLCLPLVTHLGDNEFALYISSPSRVLRHFLLFSCFWSTYQTVHTKTALEISHCEFIPTEENVCPYQDLNSAVRLMSNFFLQTCIYTFVAMNYAQTDR